MKETLELWIMRLMLFGIIIWIINMIIKLSLYIIIFLPFALITILFIGKFFNLEYKKVTWKAIFGFKK